MNNIKNTKIILASQSPRRKELMTQAGFEFEIITSDIEEKITHTTTEDVVKELSFQKAKDVFVKILDTLNTNNTVDDDLSLIVIGADTVVSFDNNIMGKPQNKEDAFAMINRIQGNTHQVYTGVSIFSYNFSNKRSMSHSFAERTDVTLYPMTPSEIRDYISTGDSMDKAGGYGIQGPFAVYVKSIIGDYNNVVGLPIARLYHELSKHFRF